MNTLRSVFRLLTLCGYWRPRSWSSPFKKFLYTVYTIIVLLLIYSITICQILDIFFNVKNQDEFSDNFNFLLAMLIACHKAYSLLVIRGKIAIIIGILEREPFLPGNEEEIEIRTRFNDRAETNTLLYVFLVEVSVAAIFISGLQKIESRTLPYRIWTPYNYTSLRLYTLTYVQQVLAWTAGSLTNVACDCLLSGLLIHTNSQIKILGCRLKAIKRGGNESVKSCVRYHDSVYRLVFALAFPNRFATMINREFGIVILVQFAMSALVLCFNLYQLAKMGGHSSRILHVLMYTSCMLTQIFIYCWYGNEVQLKSLEVSAALFGTDWTQLDINIRRSFFMIMKRATIPIKITSAYIVSMNLESFVNLLKTAYSAYNVLQQGKE